MTHFLAKKDTWEPASTEISDTTTDRCGGDQEKDDERKRIQTRIGRETCRRYRLTRRKFPACKLENARARTDALEEVDRDEYYLIALTSDALQRMVDNAGTIASLYNCDDITKENGEGITRSTRASDCGPFVIRLYNLRRRQSGDLHPILFAALMTDGKKSCLGTILQTKENELENLSECIVSISGFVMGIRSDFESHDAASSKCLNINDDRCSNDESKKEVTASNEVSKFLQQENKCTPYIFITRYELLYKKRRRTKVDAKGATIERQRSNEKDKTNFTSEELNFQNCEYMFEKRGRLASFLSSSTFQIDDFISFNQDEIPGERCYDHDHDHETMIDRNSKMIEDSLEVSNFFEQHTAIMALQRKNENASLLSSSSFSLMLGSQRYFQTYTSALKEFNHNQKEEHFAFMSNMVEEYRLADFTIKDLMQYTNTLECALQCQDEKLSSELILRWHTLLLDNRSDQESGDFRSEKVAKRIGEFCDALESNWVPKIMEDPTNALQIACFVSAAMMGLLDIAPFEAGNQRLAGIVLHWALRRAGWPFCITFYSNRVEKRSYHSAIIATRKNLCLVPQGDVDESETQVILRSTCGLHPFVSFLLNRLAQATTELCKLVQKKTQIASEETDARLIRLAREKAAKGSCIICFEHDPNVATLCCGKPIHFNCMAVWLKSNSSCPQCRAVLPSLTIDQRSHQRRDDRRVRYGRPALRFDSEEDFVPEQFSFHTSSSSSSSESQSSSSSSSSDSSVFFYSGLEYVVNDAPSVTSIDHDDEDTPTVRSLLPANSNYLTIEEPVDNDDVSFATSTLESETEGDTDRRSFHSNNSQRSIAQHESNFEFARNDDIGTVRDSELTGRHDTSRERDNLLTEENSIDSQTFPRGRNEIASQETSIQTFSINADVVPLRMSFLDPELLGSVQNIGYERRDSRQNNSGNDSDDILELPENVRSQYSRSTDDVHPFASGSSNICDFPPRRPLSSLRRSRLS